MEERIVHSKPTIWMSTQFTGKRNDIEGCYAIDPDAERFDDQFSDNPVKRGSNWESYHVEKFSDIGIPFVIKQINKSLSRKEGVFRGLHFQSDHPQAKIVECYAGIALVVVLDTRVGSPTFGNVVSCILEPTCGIMLHAPKGVAHGFLALENNTRYQYLCDEVYLPEEDRGITFKDHRIMNVFNVYSPFKIGNLIVNPRDTNFPTLDEALNAGNYLPKY